MAREKLTLLPAVFEGPYFVAGVCQRRQGARWPRPRVLKRPPSITTTREHRPNTRLMVAQPRVPEETKAVEKGFKKYVPADK